MDCFQSSRTAEAIKQKKLRKIEWSQVTFILALYYAKHNRKTFTNLVRM